MGNVLTANFEDCDLNCKVRVLEETSMSIKRRQQLGTKILMGKMGDGNVVDAPQSDRLEEDDLRDHSAKRMYLRNAHPYKDDARAPGMIQQMFMDRYEKFEKYFPFFRMDVNGYQALLKLARYNTYKEVKPPLKDYDIKDVSLKELQVAFKNHSSWSDLNDEGSELVKFLKTTCLYENSETSGDNMRFSSQKLRALGTLWCKGSYQEKVVEFYDNVQPNSSATIQADDPDFEPNFYLMLDFATEIIFKNIDLYGEDQGIVAGFSDNVIQKVKDEKYEVLLNEFLDEIFGHDALLSR